MSDVQKVDFGLQRTPDGSLVQFGVALPNGGFFPFAASRAGDYDEELAADAQPQPQSEESPQEPSSEPQQEAQPEPSPEGQQSDAGTA